MPEKRGIWFFNTNESHGPGAYQRMFTQDVAAIWGYPSGPRTLMGAAAGDQILAYVNAQGLRAVGVILDAKPVSGEGIFFNAKGEQQPNEFHLRVKWNAIVSKRDAITLAMAKKAGYSLPVRCTFATPGDIHKANIMRQFAEQLRKMAN
jgi:hypothetical protein